MNRGGSRFWWRQAGGAAASLLVRGYGLMLCLSSMGRLGNNSIEEFLDRAPPAFVVLALAGFAILIFGPRLISLFVAALSATHYLFTIASGDTGRGFTLQAAEYVFFLAFPISILLLAFVAGMRTKPGDRAESAPRWRRFDALFERYSVCCCRIFTILTLFLVSFHKLNADFLDPEVSCETYIKTYFPKNWDTAWHPLAASLSSPWLIVLMEGPVPIALLLFFRRLGILAVTAMFAVVSFCNAIVVTLMVILPALSFLAKSDRASIRRHRVALVAVFLALSAVLLPLSHSAYHGVRPWVQYAVHHLVVIAIFVSVGGCQILALARKMNSNGSAPVSWKERLGMRRMRLLPSDWPGKAVCLTITAALLLNGLSPYLGWKFNHSLAMLSNLRVDDARWNHLLVPKWVRISEHDPYIRVHRARLPVDRVKHARTGKQIWIRAGRMYSPEAFHDRITEIVRQSGQMEVGLRLEHRGEIFQFDGSTSGEEWQSFLASLPPPKGHWFHNELRIDGKQLCKH